MKTTFHINDELYRRAIAEAARQGKTVGRFLEQAIERELNYRDTENLADWARNLPILSDTAIADLETEFARPDFRGLERIDW